MAPRISSTKPTVTSSSANTQPLTDAQLGELYARRDAARTQLTGTSARLEKLNQAIAQAPDPATRRSLERQRAPLEKQVTSDRERLEGAERALQGGIAEVTGNGDARSQNEKLYARLQAVEKSQPAASAELRALTAQLDRDLKALDAASKKYAPDSRQVAAAMKAVDASGARVKAALSSVDALESGRLGLIGELKKRESSTLEAARKAKNAEALAVQDTVDLASNSHAQQIKLLGAPVIDVDRKLATESDRKRIAAAISNAPNPAEGARNGALMLHTQLSDTDAGQQSKLIAAARGEIAALTATAQWADPAVGPLLDTLKTAQSYARTELATEIAKGLSGIHSPVVSALDERMKNGDGFVEAKALEDGLRRAGKPALADAVRTLRTERLSSLAQAHDKTVAKVEVLNSELARLTVGFGPSIDPAKRQAAIDAFKAQHQAEYAAWEQTAAKLSNAADFILQNPNDNARARELLPDALEGEGGKKVIERALDLQARGKHSLLDSAAQAGKDGFKVANHLQTVVTRTAGAMVLSLMKTDPAAAMRAVDNLRRTAPLFGLKDGSLDKMTTALKGVLQGDATAIHSLHTEIEALKKVDQEVRGLKPNNSQYAVFKALGIAFTAASGVERLSSTKLYDNVKGAGEVVQAGADAGVLAMEMLGASKLPSLLTALKGAGAAGQALSAVLDGIAAVSYFRKGDGAQGLASSASAVGGAILATAAFSAAAGAQVVPVAGQIVGGILVVGGTVAKWAIEAHRAGKKEGAMEADAKAFLKAAGIDEASAEALKDIKRADGRNVGMMINQIAPGLNMTPKQLFDHLVRLGPQAIEDFTDMAKELQIGERGQIVERAATSSTLQDSSVIETTKKDLGLDDELETEHRPLSRTTAVEWTRTFLFIRGVPLVAPQKAA